jgi:hypothetical protein
MQQAFERFANNSKPGLVRLQQLLDQSPVAATR